MLEKDLLYVLYTHTATCTCTQDTGWANLMYNSITNDIQSALHFEAVLKATGHMVRYST